MTQPSFEEFVRLGSSGLEVPVVREIFADFDTPVSAFTKIDDGEHSFLLESVEGGETWGRYSFLGSSPRAILTAKGRRVEVRQGKQRTSHNDADPLAVLERLLDEHRAVSLPGLPRFTGGAVGYLGYDVVRHLERLPEIASDDLGMPDAVFMISDVVTIFDSHSHTIKVVTHARPGADPERAYREARERLDKVVERLRGAVRRPESGPQGRAPEVQSSTDRSAYEDAVERAREYIRAGDIFQVVLSHRLSAAVGTKPFDAYRALRVVNPSPYMYFLRLDGLAIAGSSPEVLVRREDTRLSVRPIAGTRPRGATDEEDRRLEEELRRDEKELAEHIMLVDLGRNDVGRVARFGSVVTDELLTVERYSQVMHLVSNVRGELPDGTRPLDVVRACFPAGTVSGAPKIRAMEIIEELEPHRRGVYAGAVGYFDFHGNLDLCIAIRTLLFRGDRAYLGVGAGIVVDSDPRKEYEETMNKGRALLAALAIAEQGLEVRG